MSYNYRKDLKINRFNLLDEMENHLQLCVDWAEQAAEAGLLKNRAERDIENIKGAIAISVRKNPKQYGLKKETETGIKDRISLEKKVSTKLNIAYEKYFKAIKHYEILISVEKDFQYQRKMALEKMADMFLAGHQITPRANIDKKKPNELKRKILKRKRG